MYSLRAWLCYVLCFVCLQGRKPKLSSKSVTRSLPKRRYRPMDKVCIGTFFWHFASFTCSMSLPEYVSCSSLENHLFTTFSYFLWCLVNGGSFANFFFGISFEILHFFKVCTSFYIFNIVVYLFKLRKTLIVQFSLETF